MAIVGVMGSGTTDWENLAAPLGAWIAQSGHDLLTGAGQGVMASVARAFCSVPGRRGRSIGIVPTKPDELRGFVALPGYPNPHIEISILTPLPRKDPDAPANALTRNHANILTSHVVIALPGGSGTRDEIRLCLCFKRPLLCFGPEEAFGDIPHAIPIASSLDDVAAFVASHISPA
jgi:predicted Rossmann-fold nucleotide-binding protein